MTRTLIKKLLSNLSIYHGYYLLAGFNLVLLMVSLVRNHSQMKFFSDSIEINKKFVLEEKKIETLFNLQMEPQNMEPHKIESHKIERQKLIELQEKKLREQGDSLLGMSQFEDLFGVGMMIIIIFLIWLGHAIKKKTEIQKKILRELSKMELLEEMAAQMAHEINNPLAIIRAKSSQLRRLITSGRYESGHAIIFLQEIEDMSVRISKIVNGLKTSPKPTEKS